MKICVLTSDDVFAGMLLRKLFSEYSNNIPGVYIEQEMVGGRQPGAMFFHVGQESGWSYAVYQAVELLLYGLVDFIKSRLCGKASLLPAKQSEKYGIPVTHIHRNTWQDIIHNLRTMAPDVILCVRLSKILKADILDIPSIGVINFHGSLLPKYAGLGSVLQALRHGETVTGGTFHTMTPDLDQGVILCQVPVTIDPTDSVSSLHVKIYCESGKYIDKLLSGLQTDKVDFSNICKKITYFSFPKREHVQQIKKQGRSLIRCGDIKRLWRLI
jgi:folate-dependent phosphoribosylglycinamide formyltransferase PurN